MSEPELRDAPQNTNLKKTQQRLLNPQRLALPDQICKSQVDDVRRKIYCHFIDILLA